MAGIPTVTPLPVAPTHDPLGRALTEEQKARLREQASPPVEEPTQGERTVERRREGEGTLRRHENRPSDDGGPGQIIDSYA